jgi:tyrosinase
MIESGAYSNYRNFSTDGPDAANIDTKNLNKVLRNPAASIEVLHGQYHVYVGGFSDNNSNIGHMSCVPVAAFDPIFWIHHV